MLCAQILSFLLLAQATPQGPGAYRIGSGVSQPTLIHKEEPSYSEEARAAHIEGSVQVEIVVDEQGVPKDLRIRRSLGYGLDEKAIEAVKRWRFRPGLKEGQPVPVLAMIDVSFRLLDYPPPSPVQVSAESLSAAVAVVDVMHADAMAQQVLSQSRASRRQQVAAWIEPRLPKTLDRTLISADLQSFQKDLLEHYDAAFLSGYKPLLAKSYAETLSMQELRDLAAFFRTDSGQAFVRKMPELLQRNSAVSTALSAQIVTEWQRLTQEWIEKMTIKYAPQ